MTDWTQAVCTVAPEWWGTSDLALARPALAREGCRICPLRGGDCLEPLAVDGPVTLADVGSMVASGLSGGRLVAEINARTRRAA